MIVLDKKNCDLLIRCLQRRLEARLDLSIINQQKSTPESKDPHPIPKPFKILGLGGHWWPDFIIWNVIQNLDRSEWSICSWSRKCNTATSAPIPTAWRWHEGIQRVLQAKGDCDFPTDFENEWFNELFFFSSFTHTRYPHRYEEMLWKWLVICHTWAKKSRPALGSSKKLPPGPGSDGGSLSKTQISLVRRSIYTKMQCLRSIV